MLKRISGLVFMVMASAAWAAGPTTRPVAVKIDAPFTESIPGTLVTFEMVPVKAEGSKPFWIGKTELTWDAFDVWAFSLDLTEKEKATGVDATARPSHPYGAPDRGFGHQGYPAIGTSQHAAEVYCKWLSAKTGRKYRLPTVKEWQAAYREGEDGSAKKLTDMAWTWDNANDKTHPVGKLAASKIGTLDMLGNVAEWAVGADGAGVVCGGSYVDEAGDVRGDATKPYSPNWQLGDPQTPKSKWWLSDGAFVGFRLVCEP